MQRTWVALTLQPQSCRHNLRRKQFCKSQKYHKQKCSTARHHTKVMTWTLVQNQILYICKSNRKEKLKRLVGFDPLCETINIFAWKKTSHLWEEQRVVIKKQKKQHDYASVVVFLSPLSSACFSHLFLLYHLSMQKLKIGSWNVSGGRDRQKGGLIWNEASSQKIKEMLFLQGTHTNSADEADWGLRCSLSHSTNLGGNTWAC